MQEEPNDPQKVLQDDQTETDSPEEQQGQGLERHMHGGDATTEDQSGEETPMDDVGGRPSEDGDADADMDEGDAGADHDRA
jgi:hypothetical protein